MSLIWKKCLAQSLFLQPLPYLIASSLSENSVTDSFSLGPKSWQ